MKINNRIKENIKKSRKWMVEKRTYKCKNCGLKSSFYGKEIPFCRAECWRENTIIIKKQGGII